MKQAKWLLLLAACIFVMLPGCQQLSPAVSPDVSIAAITQTIGSWPIMANNQPQTQIGTATFFWQYDYFDATLPPGPNGNGQYVNLMFGVKYETYSGYPIEKAHLNISTIQPTEKGSPGLYNFNTYLQTDLPAFTAIFLIPEAALMAVPDTGWDCGDYLWFLCEVSSGGVTGMVGNFHKPKGQAWWNDLYTQITNPGYTPPPPGSWPGQTLTWGWWKNPQRGNGTWKHPNYTDAGYLPQQIAAWDDGLGHHDGWINTPADAAYLFSRVGSDNSANYWDIFQAQFLAARLNAHWQSGVTPPLDDAYYDWPLTTGEFCEDMQVIAIFNLALTYTQSTDQSTVTAMTEVLDRINSYADDNNGCLEIAP